MTDIKFNLVKNVENIVDSMQLDSGTIIAEMECDGWKASIEVRGDVRVWWDENGKPFDGEYNDLPSDFPESLKNLIATDRNWYNDKRVYISENNWFEIFADNGAGNLHYDCVDVENYTPEEIKQLMYDFICECAKQEKI